MTTVRQLTTVGEWEEALRRSHERPLLVFKHSTRCPISAGAHEALHRYLADAQPADYEVAIVHVVEDRPVSNAIAEATGIKHESPQALLLRDGKPVWHASHWTITYEFLSDKLGRPAENPPSGRTT
jgi:bacillithiol system protein YtxJ